MIKVFDKGLSFSEDGERPKWAKVSPAWMGPVFRYPGLQHGTFDKEVKVVRH